MTTADEYMRLQWAKLASQERMAAADNRARLIASGYEKDWNVNKWVDRRRGGSGWITQEFAGREYQPPVSSAWQAQSAMLAEENALNLESRLLNNEALPGLGNLKEKMLAESQAIKRQRGQMRPDQYGQLWGQWEDKYHSSGIEKHLTPKLNAEDKFKSSRIDLGNGRFLVPKGMYDEIGDTGSGGVTGRTLEQYLQDEKAFEKTRDRLDQRTGRDGEPRAPATSRETVDAMVKDYNEKQRALREAIGASTPQDRWDDTRDQAGRSMEALQATMGSLGAQVPPELIEAVNRVRQMQQPAVPQGPVTAPGAPPPAAESNLKPAPYNPVEWGHPFSNDFAARDSRTPALKAIVDRSKELLTKHGPAHKMPKEVRAEFERLSGEFRKLAAPVPQPVAPGAPPNLPPPPPVVRDTVSQPSMAPPVVRDAVESSGVEMPDGIREGDVARVEGQITSLVQKYGKYERMPEDEKLKFMLLRKTLRDWTGQGVKGL
jgi:hypothetical protein